MSSLKDLRKEKGLSSQMVADKLGVSRVALWFYENGKRNVTVLTLIKLSEILEVPIETVVQAIIDNDNEDLH